MVEEAVCCEPVSAPDSLINREFTENLLDYGLRARDRCQNVPVLSAFLGKFPTGRNWELNRTLQGFLFAIKEQEVQITDPKPPPRCGWFPFRKFAETS